MSRRTPQRPDPDVIRRHNEIADAHRAWVREHADDPATPHRPESRPATSDYGVHALDLEADETLDDDLRRRAGDR